MKNLNQAIRCAFLAALVLGLAPALPGSWSVAPAHAQEGTPKTLNELLRAVRQGRVQENEENRKREAEFRARRDQQARLLGEAKAEVARLEARSDELDAQFQENDLQLRELETLLTERLGEFGELFGVVRQVAGDARANFEQSLVSAQYPGRSQTVDALARSRSLPTVEQLEELWYLLLQEMTEQGKVAAFQATVSNPDGNPAEADVVRIGPFTAVSDGRYLIYSDETQQLAVLDRQPPSRFLAAARRLSNAEPGGQVRAAIDPSSGQLLAALVDYPSIFERIAQGKTVGYIIIALGVVGVLFALWRILALTMVGMSVRSQAKDAGNPRSGNPLGRVLAAAQEYRGADPEVLELKLDDAILKELPRLEFGLNTIKVIAAVAPLLGLLGTVTGMIIVFQTITLFGTGDPKLMAGGISQALVTTVLGLVVAIPTLLLHSFAQGRSKEVVQILEEQSAGIVAAQAERA